MMRDRLENMHKLLSDDGSIWVHLDDVENHRMRMLLDQIFGSNNFAAEVVWQKADGPRNDAAGFSSDHDIILVYGKSSDLSLNRMPRTAEDNARFSNPDDDENGIWWSADRTAPHSTGSSGTQVSAVYAIQHPITGELQLPAKGRQWCFKTERIFSALQEYGSYIKIIPDEIALKERATRMGLGLDQVRGDIPDLILTEFDPQKARVRIEQGNWPEFFVTEKSFGRKAYPPKTGQPPRTWWDNDALGHNRAAKSEIKALFPHQSPFATPKPEKLLQRILHIATKPGDIVLDVFGGSGTTAAVAHKMGRRWVTCELVEDTFERFTKARLVKVVNGEDAGGISTTKGERQAAPGVELPEKMTPEKAQEWLKFLRQLVSSDEDLKNSSQVKELKALVKTIKTPDQVNWHGGGGFKVARLSPACFDYDPEIGITTLTEQATGETLINSVCANLGFQRTQDKYFDGSRNREVLAVVEGVLDTAKVEDLMAHIPDDSSVLFAATAIEDGVREYVRSYKNGSRVVHVPLDMFPFDATA